MATGNNMKNIGMPGSKDVAVVKNDAADFADGASKWLWVGTGGSLSLLLDEKVGNVPTVYKNVPSGTLLPLAVRRVFVASTAADLVAIY